MVKVCDAIMGSGKTSATITYINEHPHEKFIYITPFLDEATRISQSCESVCFYEPEKKARYNSAKVLHTLELVKDGKSIATTHQSFYFYPRELIDLIKEKRYTLIIDENIDILKESNVKGSDIQMALDAGYIEEVESGVYTMKSDVYRTGALGDFFKAINTHSLIRMKNCNSPKAGESGVYYCWRLSPELISAFHNVYVLTYLFEGQGLHHLFKMSNIPYEYIGTRLDEDGRYRFTNDLSHKPEYIKNLSKMIHICDNKKLNSIGEKRTALSSTWFDTKPEEVGKLKNNLCNYFRNINNQGAPSRLWSTFSKSKKQIEGKGYISNHLSFNTRAVNEYRDRTVLAYCVNIYMLVGHKKLYESSGINVREDIYSLSTMVQWIWRSAIREGKEIWIYIPSKRMRDLLTNWINEVENNYINKGDQV